MIYLHQEQELLNRNPFAHWVVSEALRKSLQTNCEISSPDLNFVIGPLKACLEAKHENLIMLLRRLSILQIRFERLYSPEEDIPWTRSFCTSTDLFDLITKTPLKHVAASLTTVDKAKLEQASTHHLNQRWNDLCEATRECAIAVPELKAHLLSLAQVRSVFAHAVIISR
jgi:hypothetical protein